MALKCTDNYLSSTKTFGLTSAGDYSKLDLLPLFGVVKIFLELEIKITGLGNSNFV